MTRYTRGIESSLDTSRYTRRYTRRSCETLMRDAHATESQRVQLRSADPFRSEGAEYGPPRLVKPFYLTVLYKYIYIYIYIYIYMHLDRMLCIIYISYHIYIYIYMNRYTRGIESSLDEAFYGIQDIYESLYETLYETIMRDAHATERVSGYSCAVRSPLDLKEPSTARPVSSNRFI